MSDTRKSIGIQREKMVAAFREVSGEAAPNTQVRCPKGCGKWVYPDEVHSCNHVAPAAAPTPHSDSLDLEAIRAVLDGTTADTVDRDGILWLLSTCAALLSRLEELERELDEAEKERDDWARQSMTFADTIADLHSENARMADYLKFMADMMEGEGFTETAASINGFLARASRTQSPTTTTEKGNG